MTKYSGEDRRRNERRADCALDKEKLKDVHKEIFGNGHKGLKYEYLEFKTRINEEIKTMQKNTDKLSRLFWLQFTATLGVIVMLIISLFGTIGK